MIQDDINELASQARKNGKIYKQNLREISANNNLSAHGKREKAEAMQEKLQNENRDLHRKAEKLYAKKHDNLKDYAYGFSGDKSEQISFDESVMKFADMGAKEIQKKAQYISSKTTAKAALSALHKQGATGAMQQVASNFDKLSDSVNNLLDFEDKKLANNGYHFSARFAVPSKHSRSAHQDIENVVKQRYH